MSREEELGQQLVEILGETTGMLVRRFTGQYHEDEWGFDEEFAEATFPLFEFLYNSWFRVETTGVTNVPGHGRTLMVGNHAGTVFPFDAVMIGTAIQK